VAEHHVEEVVVGPTDDVGAHGIGSFPEPALLDAERGENEVDQAGWGDGVL
jgi:hypothetical protein